MLRKALAGPWLIADRRKRLRGFVFLALGASVVLGSLVASWNPAHLVILDYVPDPFGAFAIAAILGGAAIGTLVPKWLAGVAAVGLGAIGIVALLAYAFLVSTGREQVVERVQSPDEQFELRLVRWVAVIDDAYEVRIRSRQGVLSRETVVWLAVDQGRPRSLRFVDDGQVEVIDFEGERFRSRFGGWNLSVDPQHCLSPGYC